MWKTFSAVLAVLIILTGVACKARREKAKLPDAEIAAAIPVASPLPAFREMYRSIETLSSADYAKLPATPMLKPNLSTDKRAYTLGLLLADAASKVKGQDRQGLQAVTKKLGEYLDIVFTPQERPQFVRGLADTAAMTNWEDIDVAMDGLRKRIEDRLWEKEKYDHYTLVALGAWTRGLDSVTRLVNPGKPETSRLSKPQIDVWQMLLSNLRVISDPVLRESEPVRASIVLVESIHNLLVSRASSALNAQDIAEIQSLAAKIHSLYTQ